MKKIYLVAAVLGMFLSAQAEAKSIAGLLPTGGSNCMTENINVNVNFNNIKAKSFADVKKMIDDQNAKIVEYAKQQKIEKLNIQSSNYNINSSALSYDPSGVPDSFQYNGNGNVSYKFENMDVAMKFSEFLASLKIQVSLNSNSYNQGNCVNTVVTE